MEIQLIAHDQLKISLSCEDLDQLGVTYASLNYDDPKTKKAILRLLSKAKKATGFDPRNTRLYIEVFPLEDGGCTIFFTSVEKETSVYPSTQSSFLGPLIFAFDDWDILTQASSKLFLQYGHRIYKSSLYKLYDSYRLIIYPLDSQNSVAAGFLSEYGRFVGDGTVLAAFAQEHGCSIIEDNAIETITKYFA